MIRAIKLIKYTIEKMEEIIFFHRLIIRMIFIKIQNS